MGRDGLETPASASQEAPQGAALRALVKQYLAAQAKKDLDGMVALRSSKSSDLAMRKQQAQEFFSSTGNIRLMTVNALPSFSPPLVSQHL